MDANDPIRCDSEQCHQYLAGDARANENPGLITMHTLWAREHNRIARSNALQNKGCSSDAIFNTARHIVTSQIQNIMYNQYLPEIVGMKFYNDMSIGKYEGYNYYVKPNIPNAFASAVFRYGHSQVQDAFQRFDKNMNALADLPLVDSFFDTSKYRETGTDPILRGLMKQPARKLDEFVNVHLTNELFANGTGQPGTDLASLNLQRGRDHGIPPYMIWKNWAQLVCGHEATFRNSTTLALLFEVYGNLNTIDLFVGGLAEKPLYGGIVGPTFACILENTFSALRDGDRFFYKNTDIFTEGQISEIERVGLADVICANTEEHYGKVLENPFVLGGPEVECEELRMKPLDLDQWDCRKFTPDFKTEKKKKANVLEALKSIVEKLEVQDADATEKADMMESDPGNMSDDELAEKLESLLNKVK